MSRLQDEFWELASDIRVGLATELARSESWSVKEVVLINRDQLKELFAPWYQTQNDFDVPFNAEGAVPVKIGDVLNNYRRWEKRHSRVDEIRCSLQTNDVSLTILGFCLPCDGTLLLDGNHRIIALAQTEYRFRLRVLVLDGPINPAVLPDLQHWITRS